LKKNSKLQKMVAKSKKRKTTQSAEGLDPTNRKGLHFNEKKNREVSTQLDH